MKSISSGSYSVSFSLDGVIYLMVLEKEQQSTDDPMNKIVNLKVDLQAGDRKVTLSKKITNDGPPEYNMEGEGMDNEEMNQFVMNWKAVVFREVAGFMQEPGDSIERTIESFVSLFDHFFGDRVREIIETGELDDTQEIDDNEPVEGGIKRSSSDSEINNLPQLKREKREPDEM